MVLRTVTNMLQDDDEHFGPKAYFAGKLRKLSHEAPALTRAFGPRGYTTSLHPGTRS